VRRRQPPARAIWLGGKTIGRSRGRTLKRGSHRAPPPRQQLPATGPFWPVRCEPCPAPRTHPSSRGSQLPASIRARHGRQLIGRPCSSVANLTSPSSDLPARPVSSRSPHIPASIRLSAPAPAQRAEVHRRRRRATPRGCNRRRGTRHALAALPPVHGVRCNALVVRHWRQLPLHQSLACQERGPETPNGPGAEHLTGHLNSCTVGKRNQRRTPDRDSVKTARTADPCK